MNSSPCHPSVTKLCNHLDVRVLLTGLKSDSLEVKTQNPIDVFIFDKKYMKTDIEAFIGSRILNPATKYDVITFDYAGEDEDVNFVNKGDHKLFKHTCLGGTFDRLHTAHKLLLTDAIIRTTDKLTVGITEENMIQGKLLWELIQDVEVRVNNVRSFVTDIYPDLEYNICSLYDPFGPAIVDPSIEMIVVSEETVRGGEKINEIRTKKNLSPLEIVPIPFIDEPNPQPKEELKVSSSNYRLRLLGELVKPVEKKCIPNKPYIIGLTGGIASGKSGIVSHLKNLNVEVIDCDKLGHKMYTIEGPCYKKVVEHFGSEIVSSDGQIDRKVLGGMVFNNPIEMKNLTDILWPAIADEIHQIIGNTSADVICVEAAILCQAGWDKLCHEVWVTFIPPLEAINRLKTRNNLTEEQAKSRLSSQITNKEYIKSANVVFCTLWEVEYTKIQVLKAWKLLQQRLPS
ncbi:bifunctional coenzyme A synthase-like isoform X2 [Anthonomus grandis grandis]|uniref:bifunctional coenzyme A synthase-like isoform X2 n=1 Tax=Anthonomus grandis grandis TaxID=2921223 RepID=UPI002165692E|nr:bifunctional coenzyme A synthase-like isoform X2 [Anthonomus grandis grandis]